MPIALFETCCLLVVALTLASMSRVRPPREVALDYVALALAAWVGEDSCIELYRFYAYAPAWHLRAHHVPVLIPMIWPLVVLSARDVARALFAERGAKSALATAAIVVVDASLIEVLSVRAGLWSWAEGGHQGVPVFGIVGWGYFALAAAGCLEAPWRSRRLVLPLVAPLVAHGLILATWWGGFRWVLRGDLGVASSAGLAVIAAACVGAVVAARRAGRSLGLLDAAPRLAATALFVVLFALTAADAPALWAHLGCVAAPYLASMRWPPGA